MTTLATMKSRIADELVRADLTGQIANAITDAIERYQPERFWFNESKRRVGKAAAGGLPTRLEIGFARGHGASRLCPPYALAKCRRCDPIPQETHRRLSLHPQSEIVDREYKCYSQNASPQP